MIRTKPCGLLVCLIALTLFFSCWGNDPWANDPDDYLPKDIEDGWVTSSPEAESVDPELIVQAYEAAGATDFMFSMVIAKNGKLIGEKYYQLNDEYSWFEIRSVTKSVIGLLMGIAIERDYIEGVEQKMSDFLSDYYDEDIDTRKYDITIKQLLTMSSGFDDDNYIPLSSVSVSEQVNADLGYDPGADFKYTNLGANLTAAIIQIAADQSGMTFANQYLFYPMYMEIDWWVSDRNGFYLGGSEMYLTARKMAKIGQLILDKGKYGDTQVISEEWIDELIAPQISGDEVNYGYFWWIYPDGNDTSYAALGYGGQTIYVFPYYDLVVVTTGWPNPDYAEASAQLSYVRSIINTYILPAVRTSAK